MTLEVKVEKLNARYQCLNFSSTGILFLHYESQAESLKFPFFVADRMSVNIVL